ncbi:MAG: hypothetical protein WCN98_13700, partial [Verrucomicrobiaceae bacterium]
MQAQSTCGVRLFLQLPLHAEGVSAQINSKEFGGAVNAINAHCFLDGSNRRIYKIPPFMLYRLLPLLVTIIHMSAHLLPAAPVPYP